MESDLFRGLFVAGALPDWPIIGFGLFPRLWLQDLCPRRPHHAVCFRHSPFVFSFSTMREAICIHIGQELWWRVGQTFGFCCFPQTIFQVDLTAIPACIPVACFFLCFFVLGFQYLRVECKLATLAGSCSAWSMASNLMGRCRPTRPLAGAMTHRA